VVRARRRALFDQGCRIRVNWLLDRSTRQHVVFWRAQLPHADPFTSLDQKEAFVGDTGEEILPDTVSICCSVRGEVKRKSHNRRGLDIAGGAWRWAMHVAIASMALIYSDVITVIA
jgi:hypothetical protein